MSHSTLTITIVIDGRQQEVEKIQPAALWAWLRERGVIPISTTYDSQVHVGDDGLPVRD